MRFVEIPFASFSFSSVERLTQPWHLIIQFFFFQEKVFKRKTRSEAEPTLAERVSKDFQRYGKREASPSSLLSLPLPSYNSVLHLARPPMSKTNISSLADPSDSLSFFFVLLQLTCVNQHCAWALSLIHPGARVTTFRSRYLRVPAKKDPYLAKERL